MEDNFSPPPPPPPLLDTSHDIDFKGKTDSLDMDTNLFAKCISISKYRHIVMIWLPLIDIITDILTIINYMNSDLTEVQIFSIVLCIIIYLSSRLQNIITICSIFNGEDFGLIDSVTIWHVFAMYIPFIAPASQSTIMWCFPFSIFIEILLLISVIIYPFIYLYSASNTVYKMVLYTLYNNKYKQKIENPWNEYKVGDCNGYYTFWELSDFGWIQFGNDWEAITESLPQLVIQIYVYCNYTQSVTLLLFIFSTAVSGLNILRIILKVCIKGGTIFSYDQSNHDTSEREEVPNYGCCGCGDIEINCTCQLISKCKSKFNCCQKKANRPLQTELLYQSNWN
eukprot:537164_1